MTYKQFMKEYVKPYVKRGDKPRNRLVFSMAIDTANKDGIISDKQAIEWVYPKTKDFE